MAIPKDPIILLSYINTQLRDNYATFDEFCHSVNVSAKEITEKLSAVGYEYDKQRNQFV